MSEIQRIERGPVFQGKQDERLIWCEVDFRFPLSQAQPPPCQEIIQDFREEIRTGGVQYPISILIGRPFWLNEELPKAANTAPTMLKIENERLVKVPQKTNNDDSEVLPIVAVVDGEMRLRAAVDAGIPLKHIPFRHFREPLKSRDEEFKQLLKNKQERQKYDDLPERAKEKYRLILELLKTSTTRRGGMSDAGYQQVIYLVDRLFHGVFEQMSNRKVSKLLGNKGPGRNKVGWLRREIGQECIPGDRTADALQRLKDLRERRNRIRRTVDDVETLRRKWERYDKDEHIDDADEAPFKRYCEAVLKPLEENIQTIEKRIDDKRDEAYKKAVAGNLGPACAFFEANQTVAEALDELVFGEVSDLVDDRYIDFMEIEDSGKESKEQEDSASETD